ncbi:hypothetical protein Krac_1466 [Ktedonobacter racemifer DSM 44963]|uniref:Uncharacterized protein n=1 Tax=Ktedonobacter racemifer DSM 44963 TaxID=485913 RepID=D6U1V3_KTERA|nr:hypothetical protein Krac_1466 [Ktedonobacter racemifer DSM 44963]
MNYESSATIFWLVAKVAFHFFLVSSRSNSQMLSHC